MKRSGKAFMYAYTAIVAYTLGAAGIVAGIEAIKASAPQQVAQPVAQTKPVVLKPLKVSKSQKAVDQLAALTPGCSVHDWGCVVAAGGAK